MVGVSGIMGAISQSDFDTKLCASTKLLSDLDSDANTKLDGIEVGADVNVGEEYTTGEQTKVGNMTVDMLPMEIYDGAPGSPTTDDLAYIEGVLKRYNGSTWDSVKLAVQDA